MAALWNACAKGSGSSMAPSLIVAAADPMATYEGALQALQRFVDTKEFDGGSKVIAFKSARCVFSQYAPTSTSQFFFLGKKSYKLVVSKQYFRDKGETQEIQNAQGFVFKLYSALQAVTGNRSRLGFLDI